MCLRVYWGDTFKDCMTLKSFERCGNIELVVQRRTQGEHHEAIFSRFDAVGSAIDSLRGRADAPDRSNAAARCHIDAVHPPRRHLRRVPPILDTIRATRLSISFSTRYVSSVTIRISWCVSRGAG